MREIPCVRVGTAKCGAAWDNVSLLDSTRLSPFSFLSYRKIETRALSITLLAVTENTSLNII